MGGRVLGVYKLGRDSSGAGEKGVSNSEEEVQAVNASADSIVDSDDGSGDDTPRLLFQSLRDVRELEATTDSRELSSRGENCTPLGVSRKRRLQRVVSSVASVGSSEKLFSWNHSRAME